MSTIEEPLFLGLDSSTQTLKAIAIDSNLKEIYVNIVNFDSDLPHFGTKGGAFQHADHLTVTTPTVVWIAALDLLLQKMKKDNFPFRNVVAIAGSGQQHGSVYWAKGSNSLLKNLSPNTSLFDQLKDSFSIKDSPIWMDSSTAAECKKLEDKLGGPRAVAELTGSRAFERFTGNQIAKLARLHPDQIEATERIQLVSSFVASLFLGDYAPIDAGDGSGMNIMNIRTKKWVEEALEVVFPGKTELLKSQLGEVSDAHVQIGKISPYYVATYGFNPDCAIFPFSGDNPCSLAGLKLGAGNIAISLGTSDTLFGPLALLNLSAMGGSVMCDPVNPNGHMILFTFKNGSLTREWVRDQSANKDWSTFNRLLDETQPGNNGQIGFYFLQPEITPTFNHKAIHRFDAKDNEVSEFSASAEVRAVIEGHFLSMYSHATDAGVRATSLWATGGASLNSHILQIVADIFGVPVLTTEQPNSACLGAAFRALHGWKSTKNFVDFQSVVGTNNILLKTLPREKEHALYKEILPRYAKLEKQVVEKYNK